MTQTPKAAKRKRGAAAQIFSDGAAITSSATGSASTAAADHLGQGMAGEKADQQESAPLLVHAVAGVGPGQGEDRDAEQVSQPSEFLQELYKHGAEIVTALTRAESLAYTVQFEGETKPLTLNLPAGNYVLCRMSAPMYDSPGLRPIVNPGKS